MDEKLRTRWYQVSLGRFLLTLMLLSAAGGMFLLDLQHDLEQATTNPLTWVLVLAAVGAWFGHPFSGAFAGFAAAAILAILILLAIATGLLPIAG